jgi:hypothetical protein
VFNIYYSDNTDNKKQNDDSIISNLGVNTKLSNLKSRTIDMLEKLTRSLGFK